MLKDELGKRRWGYTLKSSPGRQNNRGKAPKLFLGTVEFQLPRVHGLSHPAFTVGPSPCLLDGEHFERELDLRQGDQSSLD